ncbi:hypothetical protein [Dyadobacter diqingensis]|uniref:hypothetical protein n=1 Tax=Dyadobacter diqingensis TaxID=2938121 RepID=UPI0020C43AF8|nr:hypothetical protein [Dyadobacter diqingensis]
MNANDIVNAWKSDQLPRDIETLIAWKKIMDQAEHKAFEAWRTSTCKSEGGQLVSDHLMYHEISIGLQTATNLQQEILSIKAIKDYRL